MPIGSAKKGQAGPILLVLVLVIGLMVVAFVGKYIKDTASEAMTKGKKETTAMDKELSTQLEVTAIYPTVDNLKNGFCGDPNLCELSTTNVNGAKLILEVKNGGKNPIRANQLWDMKLYANDVPLANSTEWGISENFDKAWAAGGTKNFVLKKGCGDLANLPGGSLNLKVTPPVGSGATVEITCEKCCNMQPTKQEDCAAKCS
ncbi:MAG: hypothetical protein QF415_00635 [Candidatus Undinarchaeales archaeon]|nr:hypothetical protein [Candidatus Undinarchaeales archaeon]